MAITYGMSVKEFWEDNPDLFWAYRFSYFNKLKFESEQVNYNAWLQGAYICEGVQVAINNCFNSKKVQYSKSPYGVKINEHLEYKNEQQKLISQITQRVTQLQILKGENESSTTQIDKGGEKNERITNA